MIRLHQQQGYKEAAEKMKGEKTPVIRSKNNQSTRTIFRNREKVNHLRIQIRVIKRIRNQK